MTIKLNEVRKQTGTLTKVKNLANKKKVFGAYYTNSLFSRVYLTRHNMLMEDVNVSEDKVQMTVSTRVDGNGIDELENTLQMLIEYGIGDVPGVSADGSYLIEETQNPEYISLNETLFTVDLQLILKEPKVSFREFTIAGNKFTLLTLTHTVTDYFEQEVKLLYGEPDDSKLFFLSHFAGEKLSMRDAGLILDMIVDENITGKAIVSANFRDTTKFAALTTIYPLNSLIGMYSNIEGDIIINNDNSFLLFPSKSLEDVTMRCEPLLDAGGYSIILEGTSGILTINLE